MSELDFYDIVFNIDSFADLKAEENDGWKIEMSEEGQDKYDFFRNKDFKEKEKIQLNRIGVLGASNVGKTFVLGKLINKLDKLGNKKIKTQGISVIYPETKSENLFVCLDSQGSEEPIIGRGLDKEEIFNLKDADKKKLIKESLKDKKMTEIFIQDFIIDKVNILIIVVDQLTFSEQKLIYRLSKKKFDKLFVVHNTQFFDKKEIVEQYIEEVVKKSLYSNLEKNVIPNLDVDENNINNNEKHYYYKEKGIGKENIKKERGHEIIHLFMAKEGSPAGNYYNDKTIEYMRYLIKAEINKKIFDIINEVKNYLSNNSNIYMDLKDVGHTIQNDELKIETRDDVKFLTCTQKNFQLKDCIINEMGLCNFSSQNSITPAFICYKGEYSHKKKKNDKNGGEEKEEKWPALIVEAEMFVEPKKNPIKVSQYLNEEGDSMILTITCNKKFVKDDDIEEIETLEGDIKEGLINITIKINLENLVPDPSEKYIVKASEPGIITVYIKIIDDKKQTNFTSKIISKGKVTTK